MAKIPKAEIIKHPGNWVGGNVKKAAWSAVFESFLIMILGILFVIWPDTMIKLLAYFVGAFFIVKGGFIVISYYMQKNQQDFMNNNLLYGIIFILIGVAALLIGENIAHVFRVIVGIIVIYESLVRINTASKLYSVGVASWRYILLLSLIMLVLGIFITFNTGAIVTLIGWLMIATGIIGLVSDVVFVQHVNIVIDKINGKKK